MKIAIHYTVYNCNAYIDIIYYIYNYIPLNIIKNGFFKDPLACTTTNEQTQQSLNLNYGIYL